jgi:N-formylmaleamate deformylase
MRYGGKGPAVILIPGITSPAITWGFVAERLAERYDVYVIDVRGRGLSSTGPDLDYGLDAMAADVVGLHRPSGFPGRRCSVIPWARALRSARRFPHRRSFSRLALIDPPVSGPGRRAYPSKLPWYVDSIRLAREGHRRARHEGVSARHGPTNS